MYAAAFPCMAKRTNIDAHVRVEDCRNQCYCIKHHSLGAGQLASGQLVMRVRACTPFYSTSCMVVSGDLNKADLLPAEMISLTRMVACEEVLWLLDSTAFRV